MTGAYATCARVVLAVTRDEEIHLLLLFRLHAHIKRNLRQTLSSQISKKKLTDQRVEEYKEQQEQQKKRPNKKARVRLLIHNNKKNHGSNTQTMHAMMEEEQLLKVCKHLDDRRP